MARAVRPPRTAAPDAQEAALKTTEEKKQKPKKTQKKTNSQKHRKRRANATQRERAAGVAQRAGEGKHREVPGAPPGSKQAEKKQNTQTAKQATKTEGRRREAGSGCGGCPGHRQAGGR